jgi:hypothetical protein
VRRVSSGAVSMMRLNVCRPRARMLNINETNRRDVDGQNCDQYARAVSRTRLGCVTCSPTDWPHSRPGIRFTQRIDVTPRDACRRGVAHFLITSTSLASSRGASRQAAIALATRNDCAHHAILRSIISHPLRWLERLPHLEPEGALVLRQFVLGEHLNWRAYAVCGNFRDLLRLRRLCSVHVDPATPCGAHAQRPPRCAIHVPASCRNASRSRGKSCAIAAET